MSPALIAEKEKQRKFLEQLMDGSKLESYNIVVPVKAELRKYQQVDTDVMEAAGSGKLLYV